MAWTTSSFLFHGGNYSQAKPLLTSNCEIKCYPCSPLFTQIEEAVSQPEHEIWVSLLDYHIKTQYHNITSARQPIFQHGRMPQKNLLPIQTLTNAYLQKYSKWVMNMLHVCSKTNSRVPTTTTYPIQVCSEPGYQNRLHFITWSPGSIRPYQWNNYRR